MTGFHCLHCASEDSTVVHRGVRDHLAERPGRFDYVRCTGCALVQLHPIPETLHEHYEDYRLHQPKSALYRALQRVFLGHCYFAERPIAGNRFLDFGCGDGAALVAVRKLGWDPVGVELEADYAHSLDARMDFPVVAAEEMYARLEPASFDVISLNFVFEHLTEPLRTLETLHAFLKPGGRLLISVPNIESSEARIFGRRWFHLDAPRHISFFSKQQLRAALEETGFEFIGTRNLPAATGFSGSVAYWLSGRLQPLLWAAGMLPGALFTAFVRDGMFQCIATRRAEPAAT